jgi:hypothetical protein
VKAPNFLQQTGHATDGFLSLQRVDRVGRLPSWVFGERRTSGVSVDVSPVLAALLARNRGPVPGDPDSRRAPDYGVTASLDGQSLALTLTFRAGSAYCCCEWGCHLDLHAGRRWERLRQELSAGGLVPAERLKLRLAVEVEAGALFFDWSRPDPARRGWYAFAPAGAQRNDYVLEEG